MARTPPPSKMSLDFLVSFSTVALPVELLVDIFAYDKEPQTLAHLLRVCKLWRDTILNAQSLWTEVYVHERTPQQQIVCQLARSGQRDLTVTLPAVPCDSDEFILNLTTVFDQYSRISSLNVTSWAAVPLGERPRWHEQVEPFLNGGRWPRLRSLKLTHEWHSITLFDMIVPEVRDLHLSTVSAQDWGRLELGPALRKLTLACLADFGQLSRELVKCCNLRDMVLQDCSALQPMLTFDVAVNTLVHFPQLRRLEIQWGEVDIDSLLRFLAGCPNIEDLSVSMLTFKQPRSSCDLQYEMRLEALHLCITYGGSRRDLLALLASKFNAERLRSLKLQNVLVDARVLVPLLRQCQGGLETLQLEGTRVTHIDPTSCVGTFAQLCKATLDFVPFSNCCDELAEDDHLLEVASMERLLLPVLPISCSNNFDVVIRGALTTQEHILDLLQDTGAGPVELTMIIFRDYRCRPTESAISVQFSSERSSRPFFRQFPVQSLQQGVHLLSEATDILNRTTRLTIDAAQAAQMMLALPGVLPSLEDLCFTCSFQGLAHDVETALQRIHTAREGHCYYFPRLRTFSLVGEPNGRYRPEVHLPPNLLKLFLLHIRTTGPDPVEALFEEILVLPHVWTHVDDLLVLLIYSMTRVRDLTEHGGISQRPVYN